MNPPPPAPQPVPGPRKPLVVVPGITRRDVIIAVAIFLAISGFIWLSMNTIGQRPKNTLVGVVQGRSATGERETLLDVRRQGVTSQSVDSGFYLHVFVKDENRTYKVTVEREVWEQKKDGDTLQFLRPRNEQSY